MNTTTAYDVESELEALIDHELAHADALALVSATLERDGFLSGTSL